MKLIGKSSEEEMISEFLRAEYSSERFSSNLKKILDKFKASPKLITEPDLMNTGENTLRKKLLREHRGYTKNQLLFENFSDDIEWHKALFTADDLKKVKYIALDYWVELSNGSRLAIDAARNIHAGKEIFNQSNEGFLKAAEAIKKGTEFASLIFLASDEKASVVVLEGHVRLTAYMLVPEFVPKTLEVIIGYSKNIKKWDLY